MSSDVEQTIAVTFQYLESVLNRALDLAPVKEQQELVELLPQVSDSARRLMLAELIKLDMAKATERHIERDLSFYESCLQSQFPDGQIPLDLVLEEVQQRRLRGEMVEVAQYKVRFPHLSTILDEVLTRVDSTTVVSTLQRAPEFASGAQVEDFTIVRSLGQGSFANVYLARQNSMHRLVALKVSHRGSDEPIALSQLDHPNVVRVYDQRQLDDPPTTLLYMQYIPGGTLAEIINATKSQEFSQLSGRSFLQLIDRALIAAEQQPPERSTARERIGNMNWSELVAWLGIELAEGLAAAHRAGIMHRDVKPANILLSADGIPKLVDFNVSYSAVAGCAGAAVHFGGSLAYMSPEQLQVANPASDHRAEDLDTRSDVYSLAIVLWELWQGRRPMLPAQVFASMHEALLQQLELCRQEPRLHRRFDNTAQRVLERTLRAALAFDREERPASASEMAGRLRLALMNRAAALFEPATNGWRSRILRSSVRWTTGLIIFVPNALVGGLNYLYNHNSIATRYPDLLSRFVNLSLAINLIAFPLGIMILIWLGGQVQRGLRAAARREQIEPYQRRAAWNLGHHAAMVGGVMWLMAGLAFPMVLHSWDARFGWLDALEFFLSLAICGGIAWIYPFFGVTRLGLEVYYPAMVKPTMHDSEFEQLAARMKRRANVYLVSAAAIPLLALALLTLRQSSSDESTIRLFLLTVLMLTAAALTFAFSAHQRLLQAIDDLSDILSNR